jgi:hypothetical protein
MVTMRVKENRTLCSTQSTLKRRGILLYLRGATIQKDLVFIQKKHTFTEIRRYQGQLYTNYKQKQD